MGATIPPQLHRTEMELVLQSGLFAKSPRLAKFFAYICERQLNGAGDQVKEYSIAVEALGRSADFDPKKDSIVRVEAHRLRKRLEEYYRGPGADHPIHICIPNGQYRPQFVVSEAVAVSPPPADLSLISAASPALAAGAETRPHTAWLQVALWIAAASALLWATLLWHRNNPHVAAPSSVAGQEEVWKSPVANPPVLTEFRMLAGYHGPPLLDRQGRTWSADAYYKGGVSTLLNNSHGVEAQSAALLVKAQRSGKFAYAIPLRQYSYEMHIYVAETEYGPGNPKGGGESTRLFQISVNGKPTLLNFDPLAEAGGPNRLHERVLKDIHPAADGKLHLAFDPNTAPAFLNALEILPSAPGRIRPIRIVAQDAPVTDSDGHLWAADKYFFGGNSVVRDSVVVNSQEPLYDGERYGNFSYRIPLAPGQYRVTLHFAETWFGDPAHGPALGSRIFHVFANGVALLRNYQVAPDAGGPNRSVQKVFNNLEPNAQGILQLDFVPVKNYAEVNAIEVVETG